MSRSRMPPGPKRIYAIPAIPLTAVGKQFKPVLAAGADPGQVHSAMAGLPLTVRAAS